MTTDPPPAVDLLPAGTAPAPPVLDIVVPVYNEQAALERCVRRLRGYLDAEVPYRARITVADNASTDRTLVIAHSLAGRYPDVRVLHLDEKGRGRALHAAWGRSDARVLVYMDVDLSTGLEALMPLVAPLLSGHSDVAIGSRLARSSRVVRGPKREFVSRSYNVLLRGTLRAHFSDAQCGFKAVRADVARALLPLVEDGGWFFDTELLVLAERAGMRIHEVPVDWVDDPDSRVDIVATALADLQGVARVGCALATGALPLAALRDSLGRCAPATGSEPALLGRLVRFAVVGVVVTSGSLATLHRLVSDASTHLGPVALVIANFVATPARSLGLRGVFRRGDAEGVTR